MRNLIADLKEFSVYMAMIRAAVQSRMEYRGSFIMYLLTLVGFYGAQVAVIGLMLRRFHEIGGWTSGEIAFLYALLVFSQGLVAVFFSGMLEFSPFVREGTFDRLLLRPLSPLLQILTMRFEPGGIANLILGGAAIAAANSFLDIQWSFLTVLMLLAVILGGALILAAIRIGVAAAAFFTVSNEGLQHLIVFSTREFLLYPVDIYSRPVRFLLTFILPIAFINFYPAHFFLNKSASGLFHPYFVYLTLPTGFLVMFVALKFWKYGVRMYSSTGS